MSRGRPAVLLQQLGEQLHDAADQDEDLQAFEGPEEEALLLAYACALGGLVGLTNDPAAMRRVVRRCAEDNDLWRGMLKNRPPPRGQVS